MTQNVNFLLAERQWVPLIGRFIFDFVCLEDSIHSVIRYHIRNTVDQSDLFIDRFEEQIKIFESVMCKHILQTSADKESLKSIVSRMKQLKTTRNLIAHNALGLMFKEKRNGEMIVVGFVIENKKNKKVTISLDQLKERTRELRSCRNDMSKLMLIFHEHEFNLIKAQDEGIGALPVNKKNHQTF
jgi:hypothetical protein